MPHRLKKGDDDPSDDPQEETQPETGQSPPLGRTEEVADPPAKHRNQKTAPSGGGMVLRLALCRLKASSHRR